MIMRLQKIKIESDINLWDQIITNSPDFFTISHNVDFEGRI